MRFSGHSFLILLSASVVLLILPAGAQIDLDVEIWIDPVYDREDQNEWGPGLGGEEIQAEWGEPVHIQALPITNIDRSVIYIWNITNLYSGRSTFYQGKEITVVFYPSNRRLEEPRSEKFLIELTVWIVRSSEYALRKTTQIWVWPDADNDNDGLPDCRELYYWDGDIIHHHPGSDEDRDGYTNIQEIGFDVPLAYCEKVDPYSPPIGHFDPTDPKSPPTDPNISSPKKAGDPDGPVMPIWAMYTLMGAIASPAVMIILVDLIYIKYFYLAPSKKPTRSLLEKSGKDRPLPLLEMLENRSVG